MDVDFDVPGYQIAHMTQPTAHFKLDAHRLFVSIAWTEREPDRRQLTDAGFEIEDSGPGWLRLELFSSAPSLPFGLEVAVEVLQQVTELRSLLRQAGFVVTVEWSPDLDAVGDAAREILAKLQVLSIEST